MFAAAVAILLTPAAVAVLSTLALPIVVASATISVPTGVWALAVALLVAWTVAFAFVLVEHGIVDAVLLHRRVACHHITCERYTCRCWTDARWEPAYNTR